MEAWDPGVQGGNGVADVLFGDVDPAGRLTTTFPRSVGQVPIHYNHFNTGRPALGKYVDGPSKPLYPFGFGLTYTTFEYGKVELSAPVMKRNVHREGEFEKHRLPGRNGSRAALPPRRGGLGGTASGAGIERLPESAVAAGRFIRCRFYHFRR